MDNKNKPPSRRFYEIDLLRFLAAFAVVMFHFTYRGWVRDDMSDVAYPVIGPFFQVGYLGVDLFFIISGFVISLTAEGRTPQGFAISRMVRLYPAYWFSVTLTALAIVLLGDGRFSVTLSQWFANLSMVHSLAGVPHVDGVYWTLFVELKFYFLIFVVLLIGQIHRLREFLIGWLLASWALYFVGHVPVVSFFLFPEWSPYFIAGAVFYLVYRDGRLGPLYGLMLAACYGLSLLNAAQLLDSADPAQVADNELLVVSILITLFFAVFVLIATNRLKNVQGRWLVYLGALTYPLYLLHQMIGFVLFNLIGDRVEKYTLLLILVALMLALSWFVARGIEKPLAPLFKKWLVTHSVRIFGKA